MAHALENEFRYAANKEAAAQPSLDAAKNQQVPQPTIPPAEMGALTGPWFQWAIVWPSVLTAAHVWLGLTLSDLWTAHYGYWGLPGYLYPAYTYHRPELAFVILVVGALLLWQILARWPLGTGAR